MRSLKFGKAASMDLAFSDDLSVTCFREPTQASCVDALYAVKAALREPLDYPDLACAIVPDDRVVVAMGQAVPQCDAVLRGIVESLLAIGVEARNVQILLGPTSVSACTLRRLSETWQGMVTLLQHDARDRMSVAYLAATAAGHPVYINRHICDADLVLSVGCLQPHPSAANFGLYDAVYPAFADEDTIRRFYREGHRRGGQTCRREAEEAGWLLGARLTLQIVPGAGDRVLHVLAGDIDSVADSGHALARQAWSWKVDAPADLVIAAIDGGPNQQTWQNLFRCLEAAAQIIDESGAVVICCELSDSIDHHTLAQILQRDPFGIGTDKDNVLDMEMIQPARLIPELANATIYLHSLLADELVEDLGMIPVRDSQEISRICARSQHAVMFENGQHVWPELKHRAAIEGAVHPAASVRKKQI